VWEECTACPGRLDVGCSWTKPTFDEEGGETELSYEGGGYGCNGFRHGVTGKVGDWVKFMAQDNDIVQLHPNADHTCDLTGATKLDEGTTKGVLAFTYEFGTAGTYHFTTTTAGACEAGQKFSVVIDESVANTAAGNVDHSYMMMAPDHTHMPGPDDDFEAFGKGVYHDRAYAHDLHTPCNSETFCVDRPVSRGSCYYAGEDFQIGHAVICDVPEVECCGYTGCTARANRGKYLDGTTQTHSFHLGLTQSHSYYWYPPGYLSGGKCCHCMASCDLLSQHTETCKYRDVTTKDCQRTEDPMSFEEDQIGHQMCAVPGSTDATQDTADLACFRQAGSSQLPSCLEAEDEDTATMESPGTHQIKGLSVTVAWTVVVLAWCTLW